MSAIAPVINVLGTAQVSAEVYSSISSAAKLASIIRDRGRRMQIIYGLRKVNRSLQRLLDDVNEAIAGKRPPEEPTVKVTPQQIQMTIDNLCHLQRMVDYVYECSHRARLTNNSLAAAPLRTLHAQNEALQDLIDWFDIAKNPEYYNEIFDRAAKEKERGELFDFPRVD